MSTDVAQLQRIKESVCQKALEHFMTLNKHLRILSLRLFQTSHEISQCKNMPSEINSGEFVCISETMTANEKVQGLFVVWFFSHSLQRFSLIPLKM